MAFARQGTFTNEPNSIPNVPSPSWTPDQIRAAWQTPSDELKATLNQLVDDLNAPGWVDNSRLADGSVSTSKLDPAILAQPTTTTEVQAKLQQHDEELAEKASQVSVDEITNQSGIFKTLSKMQTKQSTYIIACGDSVTYSVQPHPSTAQVTNPYPALLQDKLQKIYNNSNITVENQGQSGWSTGTWLNNNASAYYTNVINKNPNMIILMLGINDVQSNISLSQYRNNMLQLIKIALDKGIEILLLSPTMVKVKNDWAVAGVQDVNSLVYGYSKTCQELAKTYGLTFIDMQNEFINLCYNSGLYNSSDLVNSTDFVHPTQQGYEMISEIIVKELQESPVMIIDKETSFGAVGNPFIESNMQIAQTTNGAGLRFNDTYIINTGQYVKFRFLVLKNNLSLSILKGISYFGANVDVLLDGTLLKTLNSNDANLATDGSTTKYNVKEFLTDISVGYHEIVFQNPTQVGASSTFYFILSAFIFELNNVSKSVVTNKLMSMGNNVFIPLNTDKSSDLVCLRSDKKLVVNLRGYFQNGFNLNIFDTLGLGSAESVANSVVFANSKIQLTAYNINTGTAVTTVGTNILDLTKEISIRVEIDINYTFSIYVNNVLELTASNTQNSVKGGLLRFVNTSGATVNDIVASLSWHYY